MGVPAPATIINDLFREVSYTNPTDEAVTQHIPIIETPQGSTVHPLTINLNAVHQMHTPSSRISDPMTIFHSFGIDNIAPNFLSSPTRPQYSGYEASREDPLPMSSDSFQVEQDQHLAADFSLSLDSIAASSAELPPFPPAQSIGGTIYGHVFHDTSYGLPTARHDPEKVTQRCPPPRERILSHGAPVKSKRWS